MPAVSDTQIRAAMRKIQSGDARRVTMTDGHGRGGGRLTIMVRPAKSGVLVEFYATQHANGKRRLSKIGVYPDTTLAEARATFTRHSVKIRQGVNIKTIRTAPDTFVSMLQAYCDRIENERSRTERERVLITANDSAANVIGGKRRACDITTGDIVDWLRVFHARGALGAAAFNRKTIRAAFSWALSSAHDYTQTGSNNWNLTINPAAAIPSDPAANKSGERSLSTDEFTRLLAWLLKQDTLKSKCIYTIAMTGQRVEEIANLSANQISDDGLYWPKTKTGRPHTIPLPMQCRAIMATLPPTVFGNPAHPELRDLILKFCAETGTPHFTTRDLRRTWKTLAGEAGISKEDRDRIQNHANGDVSSKHYDRYKYAKEKAAAMQRWAAFVMALTDG